MREYYVHAGMQMNAVSFRRSPDHWLECHSLQQSSLSAVPVRQSGRWPSQSTTRKVAFPGSGCVTKMCRVYGIPMKCGTT